MSMHLKFEKPLSKSKAKFLMTMLMGYLHPLTHALDSHKTDDISFSPPLLFLSPILRISLALFIFFRALKILRLTVLALFRLLRHHVLELAPQCFDGSELVAHLYQHISVIHSHLKAGEMSCSGKCTAMTPSKLRFSLFMFWRTCSIACDVLVRIAIADSVLCIKPLQTPLRWEGRDEAYNCDFSDKRIALLQKG